MKQIPLLTAFRLAALASLLGFSALQAETAASLTNPAPANSAVSGTPKIQFETNFYNFGKFTAGELISGTFKFKNTGDGILKVAPPEPSCECTVPLVKPDTLAPGESGEIIYTIKLDRAMSGQRYIRVHSNDPQTPIVKLTMQMDYTPLYDLNPKQLQVTVPPDKNEIHTSFIVTRVDGKPLAIDHVTALETWITAALDSAADPLASSARINVTVHRPAGPPSVFNSLIQLWSSEKPGWPMQSMSLTGESLGEVAAIPSRIYWVIPDFGTNKKDYPAEALTKTIKLVSLLGHDVEIKNAVSTIKGLTAKIVPREAGKTYDLQVKFSELPEQFTNGTVTVETSLASIPKLAVPLTISVPNGK